jgi:hypothetical protein
VAAGLAADAATTARDQSVQAHKVADAVLAPWDQLPLPSAEFEPVAAAAAASVKDAEAAAKRAVAAAKQATDQLIAAEAQAEGSRVPLSVAASELFSKLLHRQLLEGTTPRELKRLLNRFLLAQLCCKEQVCIMSQHGMATPASAALCGHKGWSSTLLSHLTTSKKQLSHCCLGCCAF